jgi:hypothetical protein
MQGDMAGLLDGDMSPSLVFACPSRHYLLPNIEGEGEGEGETEDEYDGVGIEVGVGLAVSLELILEEDGVGVAEDEAGAGLDEGFGSKQLISYHSEYPNASRSVTSSIVYGSEICSAASSQN